MRIDSGSGRADTLFEEAHWIGHVNASPTKPHLLSYCHEGPWDEVDNRIWGIDAATGRNWAIRPATEGANVGHEYWLADGEHLGYHGGHHGRGGDGTAFFGSVRFDNTEHSEAAFPYRSQHAHSNDLKLIVGDGSRERP